MAQAPSAPGPSPADHSGHARPHAVGDTISGWRRALRYHLTRAAISIAVRVYVRLRVEGLERLPPGPSLLCLNHQSWVDPFIAVAALPATPRLHWFGPKEEDMAVGGRNRLMIWVGTAVPFKPAKTDLRETARRVEATFDAGNRLGIFGEGRIHAMEGELLPLEEGTAWFAARSGVPIVPVGIVGTSWLGFGRTVRVRIGAPIQPVDRHDRAAMARVTTDVWCALYGLVQGAPDRPKPGRFGRWLTEVFNEWPEGERPERTEGAAPPRSAAEPVTGPHGPCPDEGERLWHTAGRARHR
jgi:1-acyl-sn-glycerol-3-phosphate acyltransferase